MNEALVTLAKEVLLWEEIRLSKKPGGGQGRGKSASFKEISVYFTTTFKLN